MTTATDALKDLVGTFLQKRWTSDFGEGPPHRFGAGRLLVYVPGLGVPLPQKAPAGAPNGLVDLVLNVLGQIVPLITG